MVAVVAAWLIREVPLRGSAPATPVAAGTPVDADHQPKHAAPERAPRHALTDA